MSIKKQSPLADAKRHQLCLELAKHLHDRAKEQGWDALANSDPETIAKKYKLVLQRLLGFKPK